MKTQSTRKHIIILGDGMADLPIEKLGGKTPLQVAHKPFMDQLAANGRCGYLQTVPQGIAPGSEVANLTVMGYDPRECNQGRGVLEAASMGVELADDETAMRCNLICLDEEGRIKNHSAGHISSAEAAQIIQTLDEQLGQGRYRFYPGVSYRHLFTSCGLNPALECAPPHDHPNEFAHSLLIRPKFDTDQDAVIAAATLNELTRRSWEILPNHPINTQRVALGKDPANSIWLWAPGRKPKMWTYQERFGVHGAVISAVDLIRGIGRYAGLDSIMVEGATGLYDTNYEGKAAACLDALNTYDFVYVHVEAPDEAGHEGNLELKIKTIEDLDSRLVSLIMKGVEKSGWQATIAVLPDHPTPVEQRVHISTPVPFVISKPGQTPDTVQTFDEVACLKGGYGQLAGSAFIELVMNVESN